MINKNIYINIIILICLTLFTSCSNTKESTDNIPIKTDSEKQDITIEASWSTTKWNEDCKAYYDRIISKHADNYDDCTAENIDKEKWSECKRRLALEKYWFDMKSR